MNNARTVRKLCEKYTVRLVDILEEATAEDGIFEEDNINQELKIEYSTLASVIIDLENILNK